ncbi:MAG: esterase/lipase family protein [Actinomycetales bacterium]
MDAPSALVVFLPGIGGSQLADPRTGSLIWSARPRDLSLLKHPDRLNINEFPQLNPVGLIPTRKAFGIWTAIHGYDGALRDLSRDLVLRLDDGNPETEDLDATLVAIGYDFRQSITASAEYVGDQIAKRVTHLWPAEHDQRRRVVVVAHSMGGLVARAWASQFDEHDTCRGIITLGSPHRGAPKALDVWCNGVRLPVIGAHVPRPFITKPLGVLRDWPGFADLLPRYRMIEDIRETSTTRNLYPSDDLTASVAAHHRLAGLTKAAQEAANRHDDITAGWKNLASQPALTVRMGFGQKTLRSATWDGTTMRVSHGKPAIFPDGDGWTAALGDGTVPAFSTIPVDVGNLAPYDCDVDFTHSRLAALPVAELVRKHLQFGRLDDPVYRGGDGTDLTLDLDSPEVALAGTSVQVRARVQTLSAGPYESSDPGPASLRWARIDDDRGTPERATAVAMKLEDGHWVSSLPGLPPGLYEVTCESETLELDTTRTVEVVDDDDLD